jgi:hypothetical protein
MEEVTSLFRYLVNNNNNNNNNKEAQTHHKHIISSNKTATQPTVTHCNILNVNFCFAFN